MFKAIKDQRGVAHVAIVVGVLIFLAVAGLVVWRVADPDANPLEVFESYPDCAIEDKKICKFLSLWTGGIDYKVTSTQTSSGQTSTFMHEMSNNSTRYHTKVDTGAGTVEVIGVDNTLYVKDQTSDKWYKKVTDSSENNASQYDILDDFSDEAAKTKNGTGDNKTEYKKITTEKCGNLTCYKYQVINNDNPDATQFMWFDNKDYKLRKLTSENSSGTSTQEFSYENISIEAPTNVEEIIQN